MRADTLTFDSQYAVQVLHVGRWILIQGQPVEHHEGHKGFHPRSRQNSNKVVGSGLDVTREPRCSTSRSIVGSSPLIQKVEEAVGRSEVSKTQVLCAKSSYCAS